MNNRLHLIALLGCMLMGGGGAAVAATEQEPADSVGVPAIVERINTSGKATVEMPEGLLRRLVHTGGAVESRTVSGGGYRIQVFSDSNPRTARGEARAKASNITGRFPQWQSYVTYDAPYWRVRVGDFISLQSAQDALAELKEAFPAYKRELRIVRDRINL